jgi:hypothetical protein
MQVHRAGVDVVVGPGLVHGPQQGARLLVHDGDERARRRPHVDPAVGRFPAAVVEEAPPLHQEAALLQVLGRLHGPGSEHLEVLHGQRLLARGAGQVRADHVRVGRIDDGRLGWLGEQVLRVADQVLVQGIVLSHQDRQRGGRAAPGPPSLLPHRSPGSRVPGDECGVQRAHVDPELQRVGGGHPQELPRR